VTFELQTETKMKRQLTEPILMAAIAALFLMITSVAAQNVSEAERQYREALHKQQVEGDLNGAVKIYQSLVAAKTTDRVMKAKALLQLATANETLGKESDARSLYERIVMEFLDQPAATKAKEWLDAHRTIAPPTMTLRKIEFGNGVQDVVATDGKRAVYWDIPTHRLLIGDVGGKNTRLVYQAEANRVPEVFVSRDLSMALFHFANVPPKIAVIKTDGNDYKELDVFARSGQLSWSWDNRYLLFHGNGLLLKISVADGTRSAVLQDENDEISAAEFSPDGQLVAFSEGARLGLGRIYIIPTRGGDRQLVAKEAVLYDWSSDGRNLLIGEPRSGSLGIVAVRVQNGRPSSEQVPIRAALPEAGLSQIMRNGAMVVRTNEGPTSQVFWGSLGSDNHLTWKALDLKGSTNRYGGYPTWSPDGRQIAYVQKSPLSLTGAVRLHTPATGEDRELYNSKGGMNLCVWARVRPALFCQEYVGAKTEVLSVAVDSGKAERIGSLDGVRNLVDVSPDDRFLYSASSENIRGTYPSTFRWEIAANQESRLGGYQRTFNGPDGPSVYWMFGPRDRREIKIREEGDDRARANDFRHLAFVRIPPSPIFGPVPVRITRDGKWAVYHDKDAGGKDSLYRVSTAGGDPEYLGDYPTSNLTSFLTVSPDGRQFAVGVQGAARPPEFWVMENFLPAAASATKPAAKGRP
jgi:Tol biopolymer transport system component